MKITIEITPDELTSLANSFPSFRYEGADIPDLPASIPPMMTPEGRKAFEEDRDRAAAEDGFCPNLD